jgi:hypothetical protein
LHSGTHYVMWRDLDLKVWHAVNRTINVVRLLAAVTDTIMQIDMSTLGRVAAAAGVALTRIVIRDTAPLRVPSGPEKMSKCA